MFCGIFNQYKMQSLLHRDWRGVIRVLTETAENFSAEKTEVEGKICVEELWRFWRSNTRK